MSNTIPAATLVAACKKALVDGIGVLAEFGAFDTAVPVAWSHPFGQLENRHAWVGDFRGQQEWKTFGDRARGLDGTSVFEFFIFVAHAADTAEEVELEALELMAAVETWLRDDETAGLDLADLPGCKHLRFAVDRFDLEGGASDEARAALISADISLIARI